MTLTIVLRHDDQAGLDRYIRELYDPHSKNFHHYLTQEQIADRFGPSENNYREILGFLRGNGFKLIAGSKNRLTITVRGTRAQAERAFDVAIGDYRIGTQNFYANDQDPALPSPLAAAVQSVGGLSNLARPRSSKVALENALADPFCATVVFACIELDEAAANALLAQCKSAVRAALADNSTPYLWQAVVNSLGAFGPLGQLECHKTTQIERGHASKARTSSAAINGAGQKIGLVEFDTFDLSDVQNYLALVNAPSSEISKLSQVNVDGGASPGSDQSEVLLDIDIALSLAPGADVVVYDAPFTGAGSFQQVFNKMVSDGVSVISNSWAYCEDQTTTADVQGIDSIFEDATAAGISVFNGSGDSGSTCLDGSANTVSVPADAPHGTAVGGSSLTTGPGLSYQQETWWNSVDATPPSGQGGFGISKFFGVPSYQTGLATGGRSVPDVVTNADPAQGLVICQASGGGCPNGLEYGGTSAATPIWASFIALLNQQLGHNIGDVNLVLYPLANTAAFHNASALGSDFSHVGLGSPNLDAIGLALSGNSAGPVDPANSAFFAAMSLPSIPVPEITGMPADGTTVAYLVAQIADANGNTISGKNVTVSASAGSHAIITPVNATSSANNGTAIFQITDDQVENETFTATDATDGVQLNDTVGVSFQTPAAVSAAIVASLANEPADGMTADTITVTLKDSLGRPTPGKTVSLSQGSAESVITAPNPPVTNSSGQVQFSVTDLHTETVDYMATDETDGDLAVPGDAPVDFTSGGGGCASASYVAGTADAAAGYLATAFATGFEVNSGNQGFSYNCFGAYGMAWDASGNMYVTDWPTGNIYKFGTSGGVANSAHLFTTITAPATGVAIDAAGNMFASEGSVSGPNGAIVPVNLSTGTVGAAIASGIECLGSMTLDPTTSALYAIDFCNIGMGGNNNIYQVTGIDGASPSTTVFAEVPSSNEENLQIEIAPDGTLYDVFGASAGGLIARIATNGTVTTLTGADSTPVSLAGGLGFTLGGMQASGDAQFLIAPFNSALSSTGAGQGVWTLDLTGSSPALGAQLTTTDFSGLSNFAIGPDGCLYVAGGPTVSKVSAADGTCPFGPTTQPPTISLTPGAANPAQGASQSFTASILYAGATSGLPVLLTTTGANPQTLMANTNSSGQADFSYVGLFTGLDNVTASAVVNSTAVSSNLAQVVWGPGTDVTFLTLNQSPTSTLVNQSVTLAANLTDVSQKPAVALPGESLNFTVGGTGCGATTNASGNASCSVTPDSAEVTTLNASFAGTAQYNPSSDSNGFRVVPEPTPTPVPGKLRIKPKKLNFGSVDVNGSKSKTVKVTNAGKVINTRKKHVTPDPITIEMEDATTSANPSPFKVTQCVMDDQLPPKSKGEPAGTCTITVTFSPTTAGKFSGTLMITDNVETTNPDTGSVQMVPIEGVGKAPKADRVANSPPDP